MGEIKTFKTEIKSLKADHQKEKHSLRAETRATADVLVQSQAVLAESHSSLAESQRALVKSQVENDVLNMARNEMSQSMPGTHVSTGTPLPTGRVNIPGGFVRSSVHPDISIPLLTTELDQGPSEPSCCSAIPRMCNQREIPRVETEYQPGWIPRQMWLTIEPLGVHH